MQRLLHRACHAAHLARERDGPLEPSLVHRFQHRYDTIVAEGLAFHEAQPPLLVTGRRGRSRRRSTGHNLLLRLSTRKDDVLRFLTDPGVPFTNNLAEQAARMMKLRPKNLRWIPLRTNKAPATSPLSALSSQPRKTGLEHHRYPDPIPNDPPQQTPYGLITDVATGQLRKIFWK